jgi:hypothetical protein
MRRLSLTLLALSLALVVGRSAPAALPPSCCACVIAERATTSPVGPGGTALFCGFVTSATFDAFDRSCDIAAGAGILCADAVVNETCPSVLLADQAVVCPAPSAAPAATDWGLTALALALSGFGIIGLRRRAR